MFDVLHECLLGLGTWIVWNGLHTTLEQIDAASNSSLNLVVLEAIGTMVAIEDSYGACISANYSVSFTPSELQELVSYTSSKGMDIWIGLLDIAAGGTFEWSPGCMLVYVAFQRATAAWVLDVLGSLKADGFAGWYLVQEPDLSAMSPNNPTCMSDLETTYFMHLVDAIASESPGKPMLVAPYFAPSTPSEDIAPQLVAQSAQYFLQCVGRNLSHFAPQDGVGSFNRSINALGTYYAGFAEAIQNANAAQTLWSDLESFEPIAQICTAALPDRVTQQIAAETPYVDEIVSFWVYNLPSASSLECPYAV